MKTTKKLLVLLLALCCIGSILIPSFAAEAQPLTNSTYQAKALLLIDLSGKALCNVAVTASTTTYCIEATMSLSQINGKTPLKSWSLSGTDPFSETRSYYVVKGYDYQVTADITVRDSSGKLIESFTTSSSIVHY